MQIFTLFWVLVGLFEDASVIADYFVGYRQLTVFSTILFTLRVLKVLDFQPRIGLVTRTLAAAANDLAHFCVLFLVVFLSFALMAFVNFGSSVMEFRSFGHAVNTCWLMITVGEVDCYHSLMESNNMLSGIVWFYVYFFVTFFILCE